MALHTTIVTDDFNRADGALGANWTNSVPQNDLLIASNVVKANTSVDNNMKFWNNGTFSVNQYGQVKISTIPNGAGGAAWMGPSVRTTATDGVWLQCTNNNTGLEMSWYNGGAFTAIGAAYGSGGWSTNDVGMIEALGKGFYGYQNGTLRVSGFNSSTPLTGRPGIMITDTTGRIDDFEGGDVIAIAPDTNTRFTGSAAPLVQAFTCGSGVKVLTLGIVVLGGTDRGGGAPTYNGVAMTQASTTQKAASSPEVGAELWYLINPTTGSAQNISIPNTGTAKTLYCQAASWIAPTGYNIAFDTATGANGTSANPSPGAIVPSVNGALVIGVMGSGNNNPPSGRSHIILNETDSGNQSDNNQYLIQPTAASVTLTWTATSDDWGAVVAAFKLVAALTTTTKTFTIDGIVLAVTNKTFTVDGIVKLIATATFTVDGIIKVSTTKTFTTDGIVLATTTKTFTIDGIVLAVTTNTFTVDGIVLAVNTKTFTVDGIVLVVQVKTITIDGVILEINNKTFTVDGIVKATTTKTFTIDGLVVIKIEEFKENFNDNSIDGAVWTNWGGSKVVEQNQRLELNSANSGANGYFGMDAIVFYSLISSYASSELVNAGNQSITSWGVWPIQLRLDGSNNLNWSVQNGTIYATKQVGGVNTDLFTDTYNATDYRFLRIRESGGTVYWESSSDGSNWTIRGSSANPFSLYNLQFQVFVGTWQNEASTTVAYVDNINYAVLTNTSTFTVDGIVLVRTLNTFTVDGIILAVSTKTFTVDAIILASTTKTFTIDGIVLATTTKSFTVDGIILENRTKTFMVDGIVLVTTTQAFTVDAIVKASTTKTFTIDGIVKVSTTATFTVDAIVKVLNNVVLFTVDGIVKASTNALFTVDGIIKVTTPITFTVDGIVLVKNMSTFTVDGIVLVIATKTFTTDGIVKATTNKSFTVDGIVNTAGTAIFSVDGIVKVTTSISFTVDAIIKEIHSASITIDGIVLVRSTKTFTVDGLILATTTKTFTVDGIIKASQVTTFTVDGIILNLTQKTITIDGIIKEVSISSFTVDGIVKEGRSTVFTVDAIVRASTSLPITVDGIVSDRSFVVFTVDGIIVASHTISFTVDAVIVQYAGLEKTFTVDGIIITKQGTLGGRGRPGLTAGLFDPRELPVLYRTKASIISDEDEKPPVLHRPDLDKLNMF